MNERILRGQAYTFNTLVDDEVTDQKTQRVRFLEPILLNIARLQETYTMVTYYFNNNIGCILRHKNTNFTDIPMAYGSLSLKTRRSSISSPMNIVYLWWEQCSCWSSSEIDVVLLSKHTTTCWNRFYSLIAPLIGSLNLLFREIYLDVILLVSIENQKPDSFSRLKATGYDKEQIGNDIPLLYLCPLSLLKKEASAKYMRFDNQINEKEGMDLSLVYAAVTVMETMHDKLAIKRQNYYPGPSIRLVILKSCIYSRSTWFGIYLRLLWDPFMYHTYRWVISGAHFTSLQECCYINCATTAAGTSWGMA